MLFNHKITLLLVVVLCKGASQQASISHLSVLLPYESAFILNATPGCFLWYTSSSSCADVVTLPDTRCSKWPGSSSRAIVQATSEGSRRDEVLACKITASQIEEAEESAFSEVDCGELITEVYIAEISRLEILTTARKIGIDEAEQISVQAFDSSGNIFSTLENVELSWFVSPPPESGPIQFIGRTGYTHGEYGSHEGDVVQIVGKRSGEAEITVKLSDQHKGIDGISISSTAIISVVEMLKICPSSVDGRIKLWIGTKVQLSSYLDRSRVSTSGGNCDHPSIEEEIQNIHKQRVSEGRYIWFENSNSNFVSVTPTGFVHAKAEGEAVVTIQERDFEPNSVSAIVEVVNSKGVFLVLTDSLVLPINIYCPLETMSNLLYSKSLVKQHDLIPQRRTDWIIVQGRSYYVVSTPVLRNVERIEEAIRASIFVQLPMQFSFSEDLHGRDAKLLILSAKHEMGPNVVEITGKSLGRTQLQSSLIEQQAGNKAHVNQSILVTAPINTPFTTIRLPFNHEFDLKLHGGSGYFTFERQNCIHKILKISQNGRIRAYEIPGSCNVYGCDKLDRSNCVTIHLVISQPKKIKLFPEEDTYHLPIKSELFIQVHVSDIDDEPYHNCSAIELSMQTLEVVDIRFERLKPTEVHCGSLHIRASRSGRETAKISVPGVVEKYINIFVHEKLQIVDPQLNYANKYPYLLLMFNEDEKMVLKGGINEEDSFLLREEDQNQFKDINENSPLVVKTDTKDPQGNNQREYILGCQVLGTYSLMIINGEESLEVLITCDLPTRLEIRLHFLKEPALVVGSEDDGATVTVPAELTFQAAYYDRTGNEFANAGIRNTVWDVQGDKLEYLSFQSDTINKLFCYLKVKSEAEEEIVVRAKGFSQDRVLNAFFRLYFFSQPRIKPNLHPAILNDKASSAKFKIFGGSGNFEVKANDSFTVVESDRRNVIVRGSARPHSVRIIAKDKNSTSTKPASAKLQISPVADILLQADAKYAQSGDVIQISAYLLTDEEEGFALDTYNIVHLRLQSNVEGAFAGIDEEFGLIECVELGSYQAGQCLGVWRSNLTVDAASGVVEISALASRNNITLARSRNPLTIFTFIKMTLEPSYVTLLPGANYRFSILGGPSGQTISCSFSSDQTQYVSMEDSAIGKIKAMAVGSALINCLCVDLETDRMVSEASSTVIVRQLDSIEIAGNKALISGGSSLLYLKGSDGETPFSFAQKGNQFIWSVEDNDILEIEEKQITLHTLLLNAKNVTGTTKITALAKFYGHSTYLMASALVKVHPRLDLISPPVVLIPSNSQYKLLTNLDGLASLQYTVQNLASHDTSKPCSSVDGVNVNGDGIVQVDSLERDFIVIVSLSASKSTENVFYQNRIILFEARHVAGLTLADKPKILGLQEVHSSKIKMFDARGMTFAETFNRPEILIKQSIKNIIEARYKASTREVFLKGVKKGLTTVRISAPEFSTSLNLSASLGPVDYFNVEVMDTASSAIYRIHEKMDLEGAETQQLELTMQQVQLIVLTALLVFSILWGFCMPRISGNNPVADESTYNLLYPNSRMPRR